MEYYRQVRDISAESRIGMASLVCLGVVMSLLAVWATPVIRELCPCVDLILDDKLTAFNCDVPMTEAMTGTVEHWIHHFMGVLVGASLSLIGAAIDLEALAVLNGLTVYAIVLFFYLVLLFVFFCQTLGACFEDEDDRRLGLDEICMIFCFLVKLFVAVNVIFVIFLVILFAAVLVIAKNCLAICFVLAAIGSLLTVCVFLISWGVVFIAMLFVLVLLIGRVRASLTNRIARMADVVADGSGDGGWCRKLLFFASKGLVFFASLGLAMFAMLWDLELLFVMWAQFDRMTSWMPDTLELGGVGEMLRGLSLDFLADLLSPVHSIMRVAISLSATIAEVFQFHCDGLRTIAALGSLVAGLSALYLFQKFAAKMMLAELVARSDDFPVYKLVTRVLLVLTSKMVETTVVPGGMLFFLLFRSPWGSGCGLYGDRVVGVLSLIMGWPVGVLSLLLLPGYVGCLATCGTLGWDVLKVVIGRWSAGTFEATGIGEYDDDLDEAMKCAHAEVSTIAVAAGCHTLPLGKIIALLTECSNKGFVWKLQLPDFWAKAEKSAALVRLLLMMPIPFLPAASPAQLGLLLACLALLAAEEGFASLKRRPPPTVYPVTPNDGCLLNRPTRAARAISFDVDSRAGGPRADRFGRSASEAPEDAEQPARLPGAAEGAREPADGGDSSEAAERAPDASSDVESI